MRSLLFFLLTPLLLADALPLAEIKKHAATIDAALKADLAGEEKALGDMIDDATFVRRAYLTINGRIPTADEARRFLASESAQKRSELIETLSRSEGATGHLFNYWADLLRLQVNKDGHGLGWRNYIYDSLAADKPYDDFVREMLTATDHVAFNPAAGYYMRDRNMLLDNVSNTAQVFLGRQIGCAQCHDHPFDDFSQREYYELASFSGGLIYNSAAANDSISAAIKMVHAKPSKQNRKERRQMRRDLNDVFRDDNRNALRHEPKRQLKYPHDYQYRDAKPGEIVKPRFYEGDVPDDMTAEQRLDVFAKWATSPDNPYFTRVIANRLWANTFGRGLVEPLDDWSFDTEAVHPKVLKALVDVMQACDYRQRDFLRVLYHTQLFQVKVAAVEPAADVEYHFTQPVLRRMSAEQVFDSLVTLARGDVDDEVTTDFARRWALFVKATTARLSAPPETVIALDEAIDSARSEANAMKEEARQLRKEAQRAGKAGDRDRHRELHAKANELQRDARRLGRVGKGQAQDMQSMMQMSSMMENAKDSDQKEKRAMRQRRAAQQPSPFGRGHLIGQFGGSDRQTPSAAHTEASIPQMLAMLNGEPQRRILDGKSEYRKALDGKKTAAERLDHIFLSFYSRLPSADERGQFEPALANRPAAYDFTRAVLTSRTFLFVQ